MKASSKQCPDAQQSTSTLTESYPRRSMILRLARSLEPSRLPRWRDHRKFELSIGVRLYHYDKNRAADDEPQVMDHGHYRQGADHDLQIPGDAPSKPLSPDLTSSLVKVDPSVSSLMTPPDYSTCSSAGPNGQNTPPLNRHVHSVKRYAWAVEVISWRRITCTEDSRIARTSGAFSAPVNSLEQS